MSTRGGGRPHFRMEERFDEDRALRLVLIGELDLAVAGKVAERLRELRLGHYHVRVDLAQLEFIDSTGLRELIVALSESRGDGCQIEIARELNRNVERVIDLLGLRSYFWPD